MFLVRLKKITGMELKDGGIHIQSETVKNKYYLSEKRSFKKFSKWSKEMYEGKEYLVEKVEISRKDFFQLLRNKNKEVLSSGKATVKSLDNGVLFLDMQ